MPLIHKGSKKAFSKNVSTEIHAGKPQKQSLAIAYDVARKAGAKFPKKAKGGEITANEEHHAVIDSAEDQREMEMMKGHRPSRLEEVEATYEHMSGIDDEDKERDEDMLRQHGRMFAKGGEVDLRDEKETAIDDAMDEREMRMLDARSRKHESELSATQEHHVGEDDEDMLEMDMLHQKEPMDSYAHDGIVKYADGGMVDDDEHDEISVAQAIRNKRQRADEDMADVASNSEETMNYENRLNFKAGRREAYPEASALEEMTDHNKSDLGHKQEDENDLSMVDKIRRRAKRSMR